MPAKGTWSGRAKFRDIADLVEAEIRREGLVAGDGLPSLGELRRAYGIAESTACRVLAELRERGVAFRLGWRGHFVWGEELPIPCDAMPLPVRIAVELASRLRAGRYRRGLPAYGRLREEFAASRPTVSAALRVLRDGGWLPGGRSLLPVAAERWPAEAQWVAFVRGLCPYPVRSVRKRWRRRSGVAVWSAGAVPAGRS
ncbi:GntR family transcriptional regulator [Acrocarpospora sp. B8E8]|uniref:GntR family transcriptional regulator n=1 Tax=Acrocarpospora sp. B8E8 TaxID=3153572 RepID=UPI00325E96D7